MDETPELAFDLYSLFYGFDLEHVLYVDQSPAAVRRAMMLINGMTLKQEANSFYVAKQRKINDAEYRAKKEAQKKLSETEKLLQLQEQEMARRNNPFEFYGWDAKDYKANELINAVRALEATTSVSFAGGKRPDIEESRAPGDPFTANGASFIDEDDEDAWNSI